MGLGIPPLQIKIMFESNHLKSTMLVGRLGVLAREGSALLDTPMIPQLGCPVTYHEVEADDLEARVSNPEPRLHLNLKSPV